MQQFIGPQPVSDVLVGSYSAPAADVHEPVKWHALALPFVKCNSDSSLINGGEIIGFGCVVRNSGSCFCAARSGQLPSSVSIIEAELCLLQKH